MNIKGDAKLVYCIYFHYMKGKERSQLVDAKNPKEAKEIFLAFIEREEGWEVQFYEITEISEPGEIPEGFLYSVIHRK